MNAKSLFIISLILLIVPVSACMNTPSSPTDAQIEALSALDQPDAGLSADQSVLCESGPAGGSRAAGGHFRRQQVEVVDRDGSTWTAIFHGQYTVFENGGANGSAFLVGHDRKLHFRVTGGVVRCDDGVDVVVLRGSIRETVFSTGDRAREAFIATLMPADEDNPACIIWDIQDSCSHEAQGKYDVWQSACETPPR
jgi:hypothetical protein